MTNDLYVTRDQIAAIVNATFPNYNGNKFRIHAAESVCLSDLNWSGGSRSQYRSCSLEGQPAGSADRYNQRAPWDNPAEHAELPIPAGFVVVQHIMFCGKDLGLRIHCNPADMPRYITAKPDMSETDRKVLNIVGGIKSSYRRDEASRQGIRPSEYDSAIESLKARGFLNKSGAITLEGKNAR